MFSCLFQLPFLFWTNLTAKATNSIAKATNSIAKPTNSIANGTNSIAKSPNSIAKTCNMIAVKFNDLCSLSSRQFSFCSVLLKRPPLLHFVSLEIEMHYLSEIRSH